VTPEELAFADAGQLAAWVRAKELSPVEIVRALRERAEALNPTINALVTPFEDAEHRAGEAERAIVRGDEVGPLHGVPFTIKDSFDTGAIRTSRGSRLFAENVPGEDAAAVARLRAAGAIALAKSNLPEFALWWETDNLVFGRTVNPWHGERTAGGSSGGEAAAIASGLSPLGIGSDLGGSIRLPAHYCGVVGLKPTHGLVPLTGHWPDVLLGFMHAGPLARSVADVSLALAALAGPDGRDWHAAPAPPPLPVVSSDGRKPLRVGVLDDHGFGPIDPDVVGAVQDAAAALSDEGHTVVPAAIPGLERHDWNLLTMTLYSAGAGAFFRGVVGDRWDELHPALRRRLSTRVESLDAYLEAEAAVEELRRDLSAFFGEHDLLLCPTGLVAAFEHDALELTIGGESCPARATMRATIPFDLSGSPALSVPFATASSGLPIGVQLVGRRFGEATVFRAGIALEEARGPLAHPPLA
jgi:Asp-tRNA(Asn)/Glu-tRNA(Gln) amidotransferase A subunit family amidase